MPHIFLKSFIIITVLHAIAFARDIDINRLSEALEGSKKHLLLFLHRTDCGYCDSMIMFTLDDDMVRPMIEKDFKYEHININDNDTVHYKDFSGSGREFAKHIGYNIYPTSVFIDKNNDIIYVVPGKREEAPFLAILKYIDTYTYKETNLETFQTMLDK